MSSEIKKIKTRLINSFIASLILLIVVTIAAFRLTLYYSETQFLKAAEQKYLSELDLYHDGIRKIATEKLEDKINMIEVNARSQYLFKALNNDINEANSILKDIIKQKDSFDNILVLDNKGKLITIVNLSPETEKKIVHGNYSERDYYKNTISSKKTYISKVFFATGNYWVITISAPIFDSLGQIKYILTGSDKLENIAQDFNFKTRFINLYSILVNQDGDVIIQGSETIKNKINVAKNDPFIKEFIKNNSQDKFGSEINFKREKAYVRGSVIKVDSSKFYIFSYLSYSQFQQELELLKKGIRDLYTIIFIISFAVFAVCWFLTVTIARDLRNLIRKIT